MSVESMKSLRERMTADEELARKMSQAASIDEAVRTARALGYDITREDFASYQEDLTDQELDQVAGGGDWTMKKTSCENGSGKTVVETCPNMCAFNGNHPWKAFAT